MRVRFIFKLKNRGGVLPFHHQHLLAQLIRGMVLKGGNKDFFSFQNYNFSGLKGQTRISRKGLHFFSSRVTLVFSSSSVKFINYIQEVLFAFENLEVGNLELVPDKVEIEETQEFNSPVKFVCISPIIINKPEFGEKTAKKFIHPDTDTFSDLLFESTINRMSESGDYTDEELETFYQFQIVPDKKYLKKLTDSQKKFARIYAVYDNDVKYEARGYTFPFELYAHEKVYEFLFNNGLGYFTHKGFGMVDKAEGSASIKTVAKESFSKEFSGSSH